ncbi:hypothetical protein [Rhizobium ruizarguesonis]|jgi:hypothetical protein|nr:hypothetical protein [Rhizobium ruizarguesonis]
MNDSNEQPKEDEPPAKPPLPKGEKLFDPWEEEFRRAYKADAFDF